MNPRLPSNPSTISDLRPQANKWTAESVAAKYAGRPLDDANTIASIERDLAELQAWDSYERSTSESREAAKRSLRELLQPRP